jgi:pimeloyl-ACP methyl ester carboxylesterase
MNHRLPKLLMLHGSRGTYRELLPVAEALREYCNPILPNMLGHGGRDIPARFSVKEMAEDVLVQMDAHGVEAMHCFGYSFGGYVALYLARHFPERIKGVCTLATKVRFDEQTISLWTKLSSVDRVRGRQSDLMDQRHPGQEWERLVEGLAALYRRLGEMPELSVHDLANITVPALTISADKDQLVPWSESLELGYSMPKSQGFTFAGQAHPLSIVPTGLLASVIGRWLTSVD